MPTRICAASVGLIYAFFGICGFIPAFVGRPPDHLPFEMIAGGRLDGYVFGWLPSDMVHAIVYVVLGAGGFFAAATFKTSKLYCRGMLALVVVLTLTGFLPLGASDLWGFLPLFGWNVPVHAVTAILVFYYGLIYPIDLGVGTELIPQ